jgi:hypothetical protein
MSGESGMSDNLLSSSINIHPSQFQTQTTINLSNDGLLKAAKPIHFSTNVSETKLANLISPGTYNLTTNDTTLNGSNESILKKVFDDSLLAYLFLSKDNINNVQKLIRMTVYKNIKQVIDDQSINDLMIIMRSTLLTYAEHPKIINEAMSQEEKLALLKLYTSEVNRLNELVINQCVPLIISQLQQYIVYLQDSSSPLKIMDKPISTSVVGTKDYRSTTQVLLGSNL